MEAVQPLLHNPAFWVSVAFVLVVSFLLKKGIPMMIAALDKRGVQISEEIERAIALREEAQRTLELYQQKQEEALKEAEGILQKANMEARRITKEAEAETQALIEKRAQMATDRIAQIERDAVQTVREKVVEVSIGAVRDLAARHVTAKTQDVLLKQAMDDIRKQLH